jgi:NAD(P)-dependent dehydrogenase (short-subunit alcohol dehydrogenase family)
VSDHVLVVGASSGIGRAVVERFARTAVVTAIARRADRLASLAEQGAQVVTCDATDFVSLEKTINDAVSRSGSLSAMVYCAGVQTIKPLRSLKAADLPVVMNVNLMAPLFLAKCFASQRVSKTDAVFCAVSSVAGQRPEPGIVAYSVAKAGLNALIKGMAKELGPRRAVGVAPGWLDTEMTQGFKNIYNDEFRSSLAKQSPAGIATVNSVVDVIEFLLSDKARHVTGEIITVDGGAVL